MLLHLILSKTDAKGTTFCKSYVYLSIYSCICLLNCTDSMLFKQYLYCTLVYISLIWLCAPNLQDSPLYVII